MDQQIIKNRMVQHKDLLKHCHNPELPIKRKDQNELKINEVNIEKSLLERIYKLEELLPQHQQNAKELIRLSQEKSQKHHKDKMKREIIYQKGDKVLIYDSRLDKQWSGKLDKKWKGPFTIEKRLDKGSYILSNDYGLMKEPIHSDRLKLFRNRESWEPHLMV